MRSGPDRGRKYDVPSRTVVETVYRGEFQYRRVCLTEEVDVVENRFSSKGKTETENRRGLGRTVFLLNWVLHVGLDLKDPSKFRIPVQKGQSGDSTCSLV